MNYKKTLDYLYSLESPQIKLGLGRTKKLLEPFGNPQNKMKFIHVAGTNGKGSTCAMIQSVFMKAGYKVGMYTSPHLKRFNERIRINDKLISDREIVEFFLKVKPNVTSQSFFEITTTMALLYFYEKKCDYVVLEVGLGGRLDSTNVVVPLISIITNISLEHTNLLGDSTKKIAFEKAGIIKNEVPVVTGAKGDALEVIRKVAKEKNAPLFLSKKYPSAKFRHLYGKFQQENKNTAMTAIDVLKNFYSIGLTKKQIQDGIADARWQGRMQFVLRNVLLDGAHNPSAMEALRQELLVLGKKYNKMIFVMGIQNTKDVESMLSIISPLASAIIFTKSGNEKAASPKELLGFFERINKKAESIVIEDPKKALGHAKKLAGKNSLVIACGSLYMIGDLI